MEIAFGYGSALFKMTGVVYKRKRRERLDQHRLLHVLNPAGYYHSTSIHHKSSKLVFNLLLYTFTYVD